MGHAGLDARSIRAFLDHADTHRRALALLPRDGNARAIEVLEARSRTLTGGAPPPGARSRPLLQAG